MPNGVCSDMPDVCSDGLNNTVKHIKYGSLWPKASLAKIDHVDRDHVNLPTHDATVKSSRSLAKKVNVLLIQYVHCGHCHSMDQNKSPKAGLIIDMAPTTVIALHSNNRTTLSVSQSVLGQSGPPYSQIMHPHFSLARRSSQRKCM